MTDHLYGSTSNQDQAAVHLSRGLWFTDNSIEHGRPINDRVQLIHLAAAQAHATLALAESQQALAASAHTANLIAWHNMATTRGFTRHELADQIEARLGLTNEGK